MSPEDLQRIVDLVSGEVGPEELLQTERWTESDPARSALVASMRRSRDAIQDTASSSVTRMVHRITSDAAATLNMPRNVPMSVPTRSAHAGNGTSAWYSRAMLSTRRKQGYALLTTSVAILLIAGLVVSRTHEQRETGRLYSTAPGQQSTVRFADGSTMLLGPASVAHVTSRNVEVSGEAYFTIMPNTSHPFVARTRNSSVRVLGTRFAIRQYPNDAGSHVVVEDGKVLLEARAQSPAKQSPGTILSARMVASVADSGVTVIPDASVADYTGWTRGRLVFRDALLRDVVAELGRIYGADIRIADTTLAQRLMTITVSVDNQSLGQTLDFIAAVTNAHYIMTNHTYILMSGRTSTPIPQRQRSSSQPEKMYGR